MKILITGANSVLALPVIKELKKNNSQLILTDKISFDNIDVVGDLKDENFVKKLISENSIDIVVHMAANTNVDLCEREKDIAYADNFLSTKNLVDIIQGMSIFFVFISTASIFNGEQKTGYSENDLPSQVNFYAQTKLMAEEYIKEKLNVCKIHWREILGLSFLLHFFMDWIVFGLGVLLGMHIGHH
jgi:dTDP-4-dehydrorhamnose reductase